MIKISNLNKYYNKNKSNEIHVINNVNIELPNQGLVSFLGSSGSGKTTLLNVIGGLDKASGTINYDSFSMNKYNMNSIDNYRNEHVGYVFQNYNLLLSETVFDNLRIALELINIYDETEVNARIEYALKSVGMYKYRKKRASQLSGGQQQRVVIARALVKHCKIIIADEPTGNLDSANAVEVMNILKSLSKRTLVLLVTHNETLANFYSDYIYRIEDGKIVSEQENISNDELEAVNDNIIYLKDMELKETNSENLGIKFYSNDNNQLDLVIVERNNTFYIKSNKNIKMLENSNIKLLNEHYKPKIKQEVKGYEYDDSFFNNSIKKKNVFGEIWNNLKRSFLKFIKPTKKMKVIYVSLALLGMLFSFCSISISNAISVDENRICADTKYSQLTTGSIYDFFEDSEILREALQKGYISNVQSLCYNYTNIVKKINFIEELSYQDSIQYLYYHDNLNLICGSKPTEKDVVISKAVADKLLDSFSSYYSSYEELIGLSLDNGDGVIVGVVDNPYKMLYVSLDNYVSMIELEKYYHTDSIRYYDYEKKYDTYEILYGRDLTESDKGTNNILISDKFPYSTPEEILGQETMYGIVVGIYHYKHGESFEEDIIRVNTDYRPEKTGFYHYSYENEDYVLLEGEKPKNENECLVSIYSGYNIGELCNGYKVVGKYNGNVKLVKANALYSMSALSISEYREKVFIVKDEQGLNALVENQQLQVVSMYEKAYNIIEYENQEIMTVFMILGFVCLVSGSIMVYFLMRSKMVNDIYNIGVYRSLGSNKEKIYLQYLVDIFVMVTLTAFITYGIVMFVYFTALESMSDYLGEELFSRNIFIPLLGVLVLYSVNIIFGLLPIWTLLKKTPAEILAKYDI